MFGQPNHEGTECLYLRERGTSRILALTCRHVVLDEHQPNEDYLYDKSDPASQLTMIQHADGTHRDIMALITSQKNNLKCSKTLLEKMTIPDDKKRKEMSVLDAKVTLLGQAEQTLASVEDHTSRIFGHVLFSPKLSNEVNGTYVVGVERLRDWALIKLHADKHHVPPHKLENRVAVTPGDVEAITAAAKADGSESRVKLWVHSTRNNLQLGDTISETEVKKPPPEYESTSLGEPAIIVAKYGRTWPDN